MHISDPTMTQFRESVVMTVDDLASLGKWSTITARRRLKRWGAHTSYNRNGRYYVLPDIPKFDDHGLWVYDGVRFSKFGTLAATVVRLVNTSDIGLTALELFELLGYEMHSILSRLTKQGALRRVMDSRRNVYFSKREEIFESQNKARKRLAPPPMVGLSQETQISLLVEKIKTPSADPSELAAYLRVSGHHVAIDAVESFLESHDLLKKNCHSRL